VLALGQGKREGEFLLLGGGTERRLEELSCVFAVTKGGVVLPRTGPPPFSRKRGGGALSHLRGESKKGGGRSHDLLDEEKEKTQPKPKGGKDWGGYPQDA